MGQKTRPTGFRVGIVEDWRSRWYAPKKEFGALLVFDEVQCGIGRAIRMEPVGGEPERNQAMMNFGYHSLWGVLILVGDIWAIMNIFQSSASNEKKLLWTVAVVLLPVLGLILWYFLGPRGSGA